MKNWLAGTMLVLVIAAPSLDATASTADRAWFAATSDAISVFSTDADAASRALKDMNIVRAVMRQAAGVDLELPVNVFVVTGEAGLRELVPQYWTRGSVRPVAASFVGPHAAFIAIRGDVTNRLFPTLLHEYVHLLTAMHLPQAAGWMDEGLADFWSTIVVDGNRLTIGRPKAGHLQQLRSRSWLPINEILRHERAPLRHDRARVAVFYAQSWAMAHYLLMGTASELPVPFAPAARGATPGLESAVHDYIGHAQFREAIVAFEHPVESFVAAHPLTEARSLAERANMLVAGERPNEALPLARRALALEPRQSIALEVMGTHAFLRQDSLQARDWLSRALTVDSSNGRAAVYLALLSATAVERERYLESAVRSKPDLAIAWQRLVAIYAEDGRLAQARGWCRRNDWIWWPWLVTAPQGCAFPNSR